jgi:hypothetical protein
VVQLPLPLVLVLQLVWGLASFWLLLVQARAQVLAQVQVPVQVPELASAQALEEPQEPGQLLVPEEAAALWVQGLPEVLVARDTHP